MKKKILLFLTLFSAFLIFAWLYLQFPAPVEMARYVPAETLIYLETNDLPAVLRAYTETDAWRETAPQFGVRQDFGAFGAISRFLANANLGSTETIVFGRSQVAVALVNVETADAEDEETLKIRPRYAIVIETKSFQSIAERFVEKQIGDFAQRQFGEASREKVQRGAANWTIFRSLRDERKIYAAVAGGTIVFGNDETAIRLCFEARDERRPNLAQSPSLAEMRRATDAENALAFGFVTGEGVRKLSSIGAVFFAGQAASEPAAMSLIAQSLPPMIEKCVNGVGWSTRATGGKIEDRYFVSVPPDLSARLREPLAASNQSNTDAANFLPSETQSITVYNFKDAGAAWRAILLAISAKLDAFAAAAFTQVASNLLEPYGVERPNDFLNSTSKEIVTARLSEKENETIAIARINDADKARRALRPIDENDRAAIFADRTLILGEKEDVARCLSAGENSLSKTDAWRDFAQMKISPDEPFVRTLTLEAETNAAAFVRIFADEKHKQISANSERKFSRASSIAETSWRENGFERRTASPFGLIGTLAVNFAE